MKRFAYIVLAAIATLVSCSTYDHEAILEQLRDHEERIQKLETICNKLNSNVEAIQTIITALEQNDYVTDIVKVMEDGIEVGYSITFAKGGTVTIYHGADGADGTNGDTPDIGIKKASDGAYYWTSDGEWLTDDEGNMIPATVSDPDGAMLLRSSGWLMGIGMCRMTMGIRGGNSKWRIQTALHLSLKMVNSYTWLYMMALS